MDIASAALQNLVSPVILFLLLGLVARVGIESTIVDLSMGDYVPRASVILVQETEMNDQVENMLARGFRVAVMWASPIEALSPCVIRSVIRIPLPATLPETARQLYLKLRSVNAMNVDVLVTAPPHTSGLGLAIADRLRRAAGPQIHDIRTGKGQ